MRSADYRSCSPRTALRLRQTGGSKRRCDQARKTRPVADLKAVAVYSCHSCIGTNENVGVIYVAGDKARLMHSSKQARDICSGMHKEAEVSTREMLDP